MLSSLENCSVWDDNRPAADVIEFVERMYYEIVYVLSSIAKLCVSERRKKFL